MMSGKGAAINALNCSSRRVSRTRALLLASFDRLMLKRGYDHLSVREVTEHADVGRSTFYEHFDGKDDLLELSVARPLAVLAAATATCEPSDALRALLTHAHAQGALSEALLRGSARTILIRVLALELEHYLAALAGRSTASPIAPLPFLAESLAHAQLGVVDAWLTGNIYDVQTAARVLHATTRASVAAIFTERQHRTTPR